MIAVIIIKVNKDRGSMLYDEPGVVFPVSVVSSVLIVDGSVATISVNVVGSSVNVVDGAVVASSVVVVSLGTSGIVKLVAISLKYSADCFAILVRLTSSKSTEKRPSWELESMFDV